MNDNYIIAIPSYKRYEMILNKRNALDYFDDELLKKTKLAIRIIESEEYLPVFNKYKGLGTYFLNNTTSGIVETRNNILKHSMLAYTKLIMIDDDTAFAFRPNLNGNMYTNQSKKMFREMIKELLYYCGCNYPIVGITARQFSNTKTNIKDENTRIAQVYCLHLPTLKKENIQFGEGSLTCMEDYYLIIKMLKLGYKNLCLNQYTRDDTKTQRPGGCAETRTAKSHSNSARRLCKMFPDIVVPYIKNNGTWKEKRINVRVKWKKAFNKKLYEERSKE